jgi:hypothetical protein
VRRSVSRHPSCGASSRRGWQASETQVRCVLRLSHPPLSLDLDLSEPAPKSSSFCLVEARREPSTLTRHLFSCPVWS